MARRQPACCSFCAIAQAMLRLLARPKITAVFCVSVTFSSWLSSYQPSVVSIQNNRDLPLLNAGVSESCFRCADMLQEMHKQWVAAGRFFADESSVLRP